MNDATKELVSEKIEQTVEAAEEIVRHPFVKRLAEFGFYTKGFLFIVIGVLAILVAMGDRSGKLADPTGAMTVVAQFTFGKILLLISSAAPSVTVRGTFCAARLTWTTRAKIGRESPNESSL